MDSEIFPPWTALFPTPAISFTSFTTPFSGSKSESMIADSFNSISDVFASLMTFIGNKIAKGECDSNHNFGHEKA